MIVVAASVEKVVCVGGEQLSDKTGFMHGPTPSVFRTRGKQFQYA